MAFTRIHGDFPLYGDLWQSKIRLKNVKIRSVETGRHQSAMPNCDHVWVNVGFSSITMACKKCGMYQKDYKSASVEPAPNKNLPSFCGQVFLSGCSTSCAHCDDCNDTEDGD